MEGPVAVRVVSRDLGGVDALGHPHALRQGDHARNEAAEALADEVGGEVFGGKLRHEGQEGDGGGTVHQRKEERDDEKGRAVPPAGHHRCLAPEEGQQDAGRHPDGEDGVDDDGLFEAARVQFVHEGDQQRPEVGQLDDDGQVGGQLPAFRESVDDEGQLHPQAIHRHPGAQTEGAGQHVHQQNHSGAGSAPRQSEEEETHSTSVSAPAACHTFNQKQQYSLIDFTFEQLSPGQDIRLVNIFLK